jgi:hypothetical protein
MNLGTDALTDVERYKAAFQGQLDKESANPTWRLVRMIEAVARGGIDTARNAGAILLAVRSGTYGNKEIDTLNEMRVQLVALQALRELLDEMSDDAPNVDK